MAVITDENIIKQDMGALNVKLSGVFPEVLLHDLNGSFEPVIAGESADFEFALDRIFCEQYGIEVGN